jgi:hypothetical protein
MSYRGNKELALASACAAAGGVESRENERHHQAGAQR